MGILLKHKVVAATAMLILEPNLAESPWAIFSFPVTSNNMMEELSFALR